MAAVHQGRQAAQLLQQPMITPPHMRSTKNHHCTVMHQALCCRVPCLSSHTRWAACSCGTSCAISPSCSSSCTPDPPAHLCPQALRRWPGSLTGLRCAVLSVAHPTKAVLCACAQALCPSRCAMLSNCGGGLALQALPGYCLGCAEPSAMLSWDVPGSAWSGAPVPVGVHCLWQHNPELSCRNALAFALCTAQALGDERCRLTCSLCWAGEQSAHTRAAQLGGQSRPHGPHRADLPIWHLSSHSRIFPEAGKRPLTQPRGTTLRLTC